jgi:hypothetical protein
VPALSQLNAIHGHPYCFSKYDTRFILNDADPLHQLTGEILNCNVIYLQFLDGCIQYTLFRNFTKRCNLYLNRKFFKFIAAVMRRLTAWRENEIGLEKGCRFDFVANSNPFYLMKFCAARNPPAVDSVI